MEEHKETQRKLMMRRASVRDRLSDLPDCVLLHIMKFMDTKDAFQTCVLSKRWKDLCKCLPSLSFHRNCFRTIVDYNKFVSRILSSRYNRSYSLLCLDVAAQGLTSPKFLHKIMKYVMLHNVPQLTIYIHLFSNAMPNFSNSFAFLCPSLTSLKLSIGSDFQHILKFPESLKMPALKDLHLRNVSFTAGGDNCAEPFSVFKLLDTLVLKDCSLHKDAKVLCISNSNLSSLSLDNNIQKSYEIELSTPNLSYLSIKDYYIYHQLSSTNNLSVLEEVDIDLYSVVNYPGGISWLQLFTNVKILTLTSNTLKQVLKVSYFSVFSHFLFIMLITCLHSFVKIFL